MTTEKVASERRVDPSCGAQKDIINTAIPKRHVTLNELKFWGYLHGTIYVHLFQMTGPTSPNLRRQICGFPPKKFP